MMQAKLYTRDEFRNLCLARDNNSCVICHEQNELSVHHIIERRLWSNGGYYLENGATVCDIHHIEAEQTVLSCDTLREKCGIKKIVKPSQFYDDDIIDKWGNYILPNGQRLVGELFHDESVQKIIQPVLHLFSKYVKYGRTYHFPWSPGLTKDDRILESLKDFEGQNIVVTVKMDGENTTMYNGYIHARSLSYESHPSRDRIKALHGQINHEIPEGWRICGENLYAKHSIHYKNLEDYFLVFSVWNDKNICLSWGETKEWAELLGLKTVPVLYEGPWNEKVLRTLYKSQFDKDECEGYVARVSKEFGHSQFKKVIGKYVRANHIQTHGHWMREQIQPNKLKMDE